MIALKLTLLGGFEARLASGGALTVPAKRAQALLAYLGLRPGRPHQRDKLAALLWSERSDKHARDGLRHALGALRKVLPAGKSALLLVKGQTLALNPAAVEVDVATFEQRVGEGAPESLEHAADLYRGDLLLGFSVNEPLFEDWLVAERERLREVALEALTRLLAHQTKTGGTERAIQTAVRLLGLDPLQEAVHRTLMRLYARQGRRGAALKQYQVCVGVMQRELGAEPEAETKRVYQELLRGPADSAKAPDTRPDRARPVRQVVPARLDLAAAELPLLGREAELGRLRELLEEAIHGHGHVATILGEAGVGKTRLLSALATEALDRGCRVLIGRCYESDSILPFGPWVDACQGSGVTADEDILRALSSTWRAELTRLLPEVAAPGLPSPSTSDLRLFESVGQLVEHVAARAPVVLILEDLHWADEMSLRLLAFVSRRVRAWGVLVVGSVREEELTDASAARRTLQELARQSQPVPLALSPLARPDITHLVQTLARVGSDAQQVARLEVQVWAVSEGNPFVAVEATRALQQVGNLAESTRLTVPHSVRQLIASRLERLSDRARELSSVAAVIGRDFDFGLLQRAGGLDEYMTAEGVEELVRRHVLRGVGERFDFSHDRIRAVAYDQLLLPQRKLRHRRVGEALEAMDAGNLGLDVLALGIHFREGEVWDKAVEYFCRAGAAAMARSAYREAVGVYELALAAVAHLPEDTTTLTDRIELSLALSTALDALAEYERAQDTLRVAETLASARNDLPRLGHVLARMCGDLRLLGDHDRAIDVGKRALAIADGLGDSALQAWVRYKLSQAHYALGDAVRAAELLRHILETSARSDQGDVGREPSPATTSNPASPLPTRGYVRVLARTWLPMVLAHLGQFDEAVRLGEDACRSAERRDDPWLLIGTLAGLAFAYRVKGDLSQAISLAEHGLALTHRWSIIDWSSVLTATLGSAYALAGRIDEAIPLAERAVELAPIGLRASVLLVLGEAYLLAGRRPEALERGRHALEISHKHKERGNEARALRLLGELAIHLDPPNADGSQASYRQALAIADELLIRPLVAHCHLGLGKLYQRTGDRQRAHEHLTTATTMYREMDMRFWLEQAEAEMRELG